MAGAGFFAGAGLAGAGFFAAGAADFAGAGLVAGLAGAGGVAGRCRANNSPCAVAPPGRAKGRLSLNPWAVKAV